MTQPTTGRRDSKPSPIRTEKLAKTYSGFLGRNPLRALQSLSLDIEPGEIYGLLGPNGAGKTTLLKLLLGIVKPTAGHAELFGRPVHDAVSRQRVGFLPENHRFPPFLTAYQTLVVYGRLAGLEKSVITTRAPVLLEQVGLWQWSDNRLKEFSKGMMQRLGIAQALMNDPDLLFLDEPTDGVDPIGRRQIRDLLISLRESGMTIFLNSHLLSEVELVCTRVGILHRGRLVKTGSVDDLTKASGKYRIQISDESVGQLPHSLSDAPPQDSDGWIHINVSSVADLNRKIDRLREAGVNILGVAPRTQTLEASFMEIIGELDGSQTEIRRTDPAEEVAPGKGATES